MSGGTLNYLPRYDWLNNTGQNINTQFGEDGLLSAVMQRIGITCRQCFEIGAADGRFYSNTLQWRKDGWYAVLMESDPAAYEKLESEFGSESECIFGSVFDLDAVLSTTQIDKRPDFGVIDIDGQDYWLWHDMVIYRPRVMLVEIAVRETKAAIPDRLGPGQAGLDAIQALGYSKGYELVATTHCNALFVDRECLN